MKIIASMEGSALFLKYVLGVQQEMADLGKALGTSDEQDRTVELVFKAADQNRNHLVSWTEFVLLTGLLHRADAEYQLAFLFCDADGDGVISRDEFRQAMLSLVKHQKGMDIERRLPVDNDEVNELFGDSGKLAIIKEGPMIGLPFPH